jgi:hypothetical protein
MRWLVALLLWTSAAMAAGPEHSLRPVPRPVVVVNIPAEPAEVTRASAGMSLSLRPLLRSKSLEQKAMAKRRERERGSVCGNIDIQGEEVGPVPGRIAGCGIENAVRITSVSGIAFSQSALMDCKTAKAVRTWVEKSAKPAFRQLGGGLASLRVAAHYACRTRNNQTGARISEHGKGRAIDISGFGLRDGSIVSVLHGWGTRGQSKALRKAHRGACGPFGTVLGPEADRFHRDHFHFDTARYRSGTYCR